MELSFSLKHLKDFILKKNAEFNAGDENLLAVAGSSGMPSAGANILACILYSSLKNGMISWAQYPWRSHW